MISYLTSTQVEELVSNNLYTYKGNFNSARCFSSDYVNNAELPALSLPGGDFGELAILISASISYGFEVNMPKAVAILHKLNGKEAKTTFDTYTEHSADRCIYLNHIVNHYQDFGIDSQGMAHFTDAAKLSGLSIGDKNINIVSKENACIILEAEQGLFPNYTFDSEQGMLNAKVLVFNKLLVDRRHRKLSTNLVTQGAVKLFSGLDEDYLYQVLSEVTENHLLTTLKLRDSSLPIYYVSISAEGIIKITS